MWRFEAVGNDRRRGARRGGRRPRADAAALLPGLQGDRGEAKAIEAKQVSLLLRAFEPEPLLVNLVYPSGRLVPKKVKAFLDFVVPRMKQKLVFIP